jgi:UDP-N-acetylglucosamine 1-carboxyvinyltransferase
MLRESGVPIFTTKNTIEIRDNGKIKNSSLKPFNIRTHEYPGFSTDLQAPATVYLTQVSGEAVNPNSGARGESIVFETIYEGRLKFVSNLEKLGASITVMNPREILVRGNPGKISGAPAANSYFKALDRAGEADAALDAYDIRAGFATVMAALLATGSSVVKNVYFIDRGYEDLEGQLSKIGANIRRVHNEDTTAV